MDDQQLWGLGTARLELLSTNLPEDVGAALARLLARYQKAKEALAEVAAEVDAAAVCHECAGQCCLNGKYRMNVCDMLACISVGILPTVDYSQKPICPYGTVAGCCLEPGVRPADCVTFICDEIERRLSPQARTILTEREQDVLECIHEVSRVTGMAVDTPLLIWAGRDENKSIVKV